MRKPAFAMEATKHQKMVLNSDTDELLEVRDTLLFKTDMTSEAEAEDNLVNITNELCFRGEA